MHTALPEFGAYLCSRPWSQIDCGKKLRSPKAEVSGTDDKPLNINLTLAKADLIPRLIITLNPQSLSLTEAVDIHINLMRIIRLSLWLATPNGLSCLRINDRNEELTVHETVLKQVLVPSEQYLSHLCVARFSIVDGGLSHWFMILLAQILGISPSHQPTLDIVLHMPVVLTIPSLEGNASMNGWYFYNPLPLALRILDLPLSADTLEDDSEGSEEVVADVMAVFDPCSLTTHNLPLPSASPSPHTLHLSHRHSATHSPTLPPSPPTPLQATPTLLPPLASHTGHPLSLSSTLSINSSSCFASLAGHKPPIHHNSNEFSFSMDCSPFLNWNGEKLDTVHEKAVVFQSLVATSKLQPELDAALEAKAVNVIRSVDLADDKSTDAFLSSFGHIADESFNNFVQCIFVLLSSANKAITTATMGLLHFLSVLCSAEVRLALVNADLMPQLIISLNPLSLSFVEADNIHTYLILIIRQCLLLAAPLGLARLGIEDDDEEQTVHKTVLQQVLVTSESRELSRHFLELLAFPLEICSSDQPTMDFVLHLPVVLTIPSYLVFFETETSTWNFMTLIIRTQREWNTLGGKGRQMWETVQRMLRMEGIEDVNAGKLRHNQQDFIGGNIVENSIEWNNLQGMNIPRRG
ncbi:hypothetical protein BLNAU_14255 [Blattamonas nauphoetae]|uniref:Uncharacterized protein n=1 Tax=Blattamonas nauphoetae TaxID=2049346 RepID=A0ABQ9XHM5_9EUKA|nr:hypothetical protein BLNAU_14255 [Blattamonas nauphoetae]